jgi:hypothetical protein
MRITPGGIYVPELVLEDLIINGNFDHFQGVGGTGTQTSTTTYSTTTSYAADQFYVLPAGASVTQQRSTTVPDNKSQYSLQVNGAASVTTVDIGQRIESSVIQTRGKRLQAFVANIRNESGAAFTPNLRVGTPAAVDNFTTVTNRLDQPLQSCPDAAWTRVFHVFDPSGYTNVNNGLDVALRVPSGSLVAADIVRIAQFGLLPYPAVLPYAPLDPDLERLRAARYFERLEFGATTIVALLAFSADTVGRGFLTWPVPKRTAPTVTFSTPMSDWGVRTPSFGADNTPDGIASSGGTSRDRAGISTSRAAGFGGYVAGDAGILRAVNATYTDINARL